MDVADAALKVHPDGTEKQVNEHLSYALKHMPGKKGARLYRVS